MRLVFLLSIVAAFSIGSSCTLKKNEQRKSPRKQVLTTHISRDLSTLDPRKGGDAVSAHIHFLLFEGLTKLNPLDAFSDLDHPVGKAIPAGARLIEISYDRKSYTFHLRGDSYWSNGDKVVAEDYVRAWKNVLKPDFPAPNAFLFYPIKNARFYKEGKVGEESVGVRALDEKTLVVDLERPTPYFLEMLTFSSFFPVNHRLPDEMIGRVSNGPFLLSEWKHNNQIILQKNKTHWDAEDVALEEIRFYVISDERTALKLYEEKELDLIGLPMGGIPIDMLTPLKKSGQLHIVPASGSVFCTFNNQRFPFNNKNMRKAFSFAINRKLIVDNVTQLGETIATGPIPPPLKRGTFKQYFEDGDVERARHFFELGLKELKITRSDLKNLSYIYFKSESNHKIAQVLQQFWEQTLGVTVRLENQDYKILLDRLSRLKDYDMGAGLWIAQYNDRMNILDRFAYAHNGKNYPGWEDKEYLKLLERSEASFEAEKRDELLEEAEHLFVEHMPLATLYHMNFPYLIHKHVGNVHFNPMGGIYYEKLCIEQE